MRYRILSLLIVTALIAIAFLSGIWTARETWSPGEYHRPAGIVNYWPLRGDTPNFNETIIVVGDGVQVNIALKDDTGQNLGRVTLGPGRHCIYVFWGGEKKVFGFFAGGELHIQPCTVGASMATLMGGLRSGKVKKIAEVVEPKSARRLQIVFEVESVAGETSHN